mmetsp:Transcript_823/g.1598  ORF Transcript_823/g.1598 Transcript_823/m.1598 type:complete len:137 (-) Transcript_823:365-775(-)
MVMLLYTLASLAFLWLTLICLKVVPTSDVSVYAAGVVGGFCLNATYPLFFELCVENTYPIGEGSTAGLLTWSQGIIQTIFLAILQDNAAGTSWINWTVTMSPLAAAVCLFFFTARYDRLNMDQLHETEPADTNIDR